MTQLTDEASCSNLIIETRAKSPRKTANFLRNDAKALEIDQDRAYEQDKCRQVFDGRLRSVLYQEPKTVILRRFRAL